MLGGFRWSRLRAGGHRTARFAATLGALLPATPALAQSGASAGALEVTYNECFDHRSLAAEMEHVLGSDKVAPGLVLRVYSKGSEVVLSLVREGVVVGERMLSARGIACDELRAALALTIGVVLDGALREPHVRSSGQRAPKVAPVAEPRKPPAAGAAPAAAPHLAADAGANAVFFVLPESALGAVAGLTWKPRGPFSARASVLGTSTVTTSLGRGEVDVGLIAGRIEVCGARRWENVRLRACVGPVIGRLTVQGSGFSFSYTSAVLWPAVGIGLDSRIPLTRFLGLVAAINVFVPLLPARIDYLGARGEIRASKPQPAVGASMGLGLEVDLF